MVCSRVLIIHQGQLVAGDTPENLTARLSRSTRIQVQVEGPAEAVAAEMRRLPGVRSVEQKITGDGSNTFVVETALDRDVRRDLSRTLVGRGWGLLDLRPLGMTLEDIFLKLVTAEEPGPAGRQEEPGEATP